MVIRLIISFVNDKYLLFLHGHLNVPVNLINSLLKVHTLKYKVKI